MRSIYYPSFQTASTTRMHSSRMHTTRTLTIPAGVCSWGVPAWGGCLPRGVCSWGVPAWGVGVPAWGVPCDLSHHAFDVTCMLPSHQLRLITSAAAYIVFGHVTCGACRDTTPSPPLVDRMTDTCKNITFANYVCGR